VIPGVASGQDVDARREFEERLLKEFYGQKPMILLCGGVWRLEALGMKVSKVSHHLNARMVNLNAEMGRVRYNTPIHMLLPGTGPVSEQIWGKDREPFPVNSVHGLALSDLGSRQDEFEVVGISGEPVQIQESNGGSRLREDRHGNPMNSQECIEAIVSIHGPPLVAVQWHAEAYFAEGEFSPHSKLLLHAAQWEPPTPEIPSASQSLKEIRKFAREHKCLSGVKLHVGGERHRTKVDIVEDLKVAWALHGG